MASLLIPDVVPSPMDDADTLYKAFKGWGTDEKAVIRVLGKRNASQRNKIFQSYQQLCNQSLFDALRSELSGDFWSVEFFMEMNFVLGCFSLFLLFLYFLCSDLLATITFGCFILLSLLCVVRSCYLLEVLFEISLVVGLGVDEKALISILGKWEHDQKHSFRKASSQHFLPDQRNFDKWNVLQLQLIKHQLLRFQSVVVLWTMHPWERDARYLKEAIAKGPEGSSLVIEIACTRSSEELLGARKAYHSLFDSSVEEDVTSYVQGYERKVQVDC